MDRVRIGIIGLGIMGELYLKIYSSHPLATVVAISSRRQSRIDELASKYDVGSGYTDYRVMLERKDLDAIIIATPDAHHFLPARDALLSGKHILVEKPFTTNLEEADELIRLSRVKGLKIQVAFNHRWLSPYYQAKTLISGGNIGQTMAAYARKNDTIFVPTEYISWAGDTTPAWFLSSHDIDLIRWFFNAEPVEARAWGRNEVLRSRGIPTYDLIQSQVRFSSGAFVTFESGWIYPSSFPTIVDSFIEVVGSAGHVHLDRKCESIETSSESKFTYPKGFLNLEIFGRMRGAFPACLEDFLYAIINDTKPPVTALDGRQVTATLTAIHKSLETGQTEAVLQPASDEPR